MLKQTGEKYTIKDKQKVNLSAYAFDVTDSDYENFDASEPKGTFLNKLFNLYFPDSRANLDKTRRELQETLGSTVDAEIYIDLLMKKEIEERQEELKKPEYKGVPTDQRKEYIYLTAETVRTLDRINNESDVKETYGTFLPLLKAVLEEYARLPYYERFKLYNKDKIKNIERAIRSGHELLITLNNDNSFYVRPYRIMFDKNQTYIYLTGWAKAIDGKDYSIQSFRLSRITDIEIEENRKNSLSKEEKAEIAKRIIEKEVQYLTSESNEFKIRLTKDGYKQYRIKQHQRPKYSSIEAENEGCIMTFSGVTEKQIEVYFLQFAEKAEIIEPESTRRKFRKKYEKALKTYE